MGAWRTVRLGEICSFKYGEIPKQGDLASEGYPVYSGYRIVGHSPRFHYREPEIVVVARGVGGTGDIKMAPPLCFLTNLSIAILPQSPQVFKPFLYYRLKSTTLWGLRTGSAQAQITISHLQHYELELPPLPAQRSIAAILSAYDDLIENNTRRIQILERMAQALYREWFVHFRFPGHAKVKRIASPLGPIPRGWSVARLEELTTYLNRGLAPSYAEDGGLVINQKCIRNGRLNLALARRQSKTVPEDKLVRVGDVLINSTGEGTLGRVAQVCESIESCTVDTHVTIVRPRPEIGPDFFGLSLIVKEDSFMAMGVGSTGQTEFNRQAIGNFQIVVPPLHERDTLGAIVKPIRQLVLILERRNANLRRTRDLLLPKLISGALDVSKLKIETA